MTDFRLFTQNTPCRRQNISLHSDRRIDYYTAVVLQPFPYFLGRLKCFIEKE